MFTATELPRDKLPEHITQALSGQSHSLVHPLSARGHLQASCSAHLKVFHKHKKKKKKFSNDDVKSQLIFSQPHSM